MRLSCIALLGTAIWNLALSDFSNFLSNLTLAQHAELEYNLLISFKLLDLNY